MTPPQGKRAFPARHVALFSLLVLLALAAWYFTRPEPVAVVTAKVERGTVEASVSNTRAGTIKACHRAKMSPPAGGRIEKLLVKKGQRVKAGQTLLELWSEDLQAQERMAREQFDAAQQQAQQACSQADLADKEAERAKQLKERGFISAEGLDQKLTAAKVARAGCDASRSQVEQGRSRIEAANAGLDRMVLRAPFDGIVADISGELGEYATPSPPGIPTPPAIDLIDDSCLYVSAPIDEVDAAAVKVGLVSRITLDAIKGKTFAGKVTRIAPYVIDLEKQARTVEVEAEFDQPLPPQHGKTDIVGTGAGAAGQQLPQAAGSASANGSPHGGGEPVGLPLAGSNVSQLPDKLLVGYSADIEIIHDARKNVLRVPTSALLEGRKVLVYQPGDGTLQERVVSTGLSNWEYTEIVSGLNEGEQIVTSLDREGVKAGVKVTPEAK